MTRPLHIAGASGFWGDTDAATEQLLAHEPLDFIVYDYLSEITLALLARGRARNPETGFIPDFERAITPHLATIKTRGIRLLANAGGLHPIACAQSLEAAALAAGVKLKVAAVTGDDLIERLPEDARDMFSGERLPDAILSANAYLGAAGIVAALEDGADIVVTGRCADSALTLAPLIHHFGWAFDDWDRLAQGSLAGHLIECGSQGAGGLFTDWRDVCDGWSDMGFPIAVCSADGTFEIIKPDATGGHITPLSLVEQMLYEIGDPADYRLPDVICDFREVAFETVGPARVRISGATGRPAPPDYKVSVTSQDGWRLVSTLMIGGREAAEKARTVGQAILDRTARLASARGLGPFTRTDVESLGSETTYGPHAKTTQTREVILKIAAAANDRPILELLSREIFPSATAMSPGITGVAGGRPSPSPLIRGTAALVTRSLAPITVTIEGRSRTVVALDPPQAVPPTACRTFAEPETTEDTVTIESRLIDFAVARSGDKGDIINIGVAARTPDSYGLLYRHLTAERVGTYLAHLTPTRVERFDLPGSRSFNFLLHGALNGGGMANLRFDAQGKAAAQMLLDMPIVRSH